MEIPEYDTTETDLQRLLDVLQLIAERGRHIRQAQKATTADSEPLAGDKSAVVAQPPAPESADTF